MPAGGANTTADMETKSQTRTRPARIGKTKLKNN